MMKIVVFAALVVSVVGGPIVKTWTLHELQKVLDAAVVDTDQKPYLEEAYRKLIYSMLTKKNLELTRYVIPSPDGSPTWTMDELDKAIKDATTNPNYIAHLRAFCKDLNGTHKSGNKPQDSIQVYIPAMDISTWTLTELNEAIANPGTDSQLKPYLETARAKLTTEPEFQNKNTISIVTKVGLVEKWTITRNR